MQYPNSLQSEAILLGKMLNSKDAASAAIEELKSSDFHDPRHEVFFSCISLAYHNDIAIEPLIIADLLHKNFPKLADTAYLMGLKSSYNSSHDDINYFIKEIKEHSQLRQIIRYSQQIIEKAVKKSSPEEIIRESNIFFDNIFSNNTNSLDINEILDNNFFETNIGYAPFIQKQMDNHKAGISTLRGIPTGFHRLDEYLSGICKGHFIVVGARPGVGKTTFILNLIHKLCIQKKIPVGFFSLEMTKDEVIHKLSSISASINHEKIFRGNISCHEYALIQNASNNLRQSPLFIDDQSSLPLSQLISRTKRLIAVNQIKVLFIDYIGEIRGEGKFFTKQEEVQSISKAIRNLAKTLRIPIICICQLNRDSETQSRAPRKSDLRESGQIEMDAHTILLLHRVKEDTNTLLKLYIAKNRFGSEGELNFALEPLSGRFEERDFIPMEPNL